jgi:hypothetical protein
MSNQWSHCLAFYGGNPSYTSGGTDYAIPVFAGGNKDKNGLFPWCGTSVDSLHNYWSPAWQAIFNNSAMAVYAQKHRLISSIMCQLGDVPDTKDPSGWFLCRNHAWRWMHYVMSWKLGTDHEFGVSRGMLEQRLENELNAIYSYIVKPTLIENSTSTFHTCLRNMGNPTYIGIPTQSSTSMTFYMTHVLQLMKTFGLWDVMYNKSVTCKAALDFVIRCLDLMAIDYVLDTTGYLYTDSNYDTLAKPDGSIAASWADWRANLRPQQAQEDWIHGLDGKPSGPFYSTELLRYQYVCLRRDWITDAMVPCARANGIALAIAKYESYMAVKDAAVGAAPGNFDKMAADFATYYPMYSPIKLPAA